jgi:inosine-uridine nucleoside N-ribohydrolase
MKLGTEVGMLAAMLAFGCSGGIPPGSQPGGSQSPAAARLPVILDTDIGTDIDDTWALALLLECPELDLKLVVTDSGDTEARARVAAKFLQVAGRTDIPVGVGRSFGESFVPQREWATGYDLSQYPGEVHADGVQAMIDLVMGSPEPVVVLAIGPVPNLAEALRREPRFAEKARVIAMSGSIDVGYDGKPTPDPEYNVKQDVPAARAMYQAPWDLLLAPLDTCGLIRLTGDLHRRIVESSKPSLRALMENYRLWAQKVDWTKVDPDVESSVLFDTLAVALAVSQEWVEVDTVVLEVTDDGVTRRSEQGNRMRAALRWKDMDGYCRWMVDRLTR